MIEFCFDRLAANGVGYPNLAMIKAEPYTSSWREFEHHYPKTTPLRLLLYFKKLQIPVQVSTVGGQQGPAWYPIGLGWFDFGFDYFGAIPSATLSLIQSQKLTVLFYYHEGDDPADIKQRLDFLVQQHQLPVNCYRFVSANTAAQDLERFIYFPDHEFFFNYVNQHQLPRGTDSNRSYIFTLLSRTHKAWRASVVSDLYRYGLLNRSLWSYGLVNNTTDEGEDPIDSLSQSGWARAREIFLNNAPYSCDDFDSEKQNNHSDVNVDLYTKSYCHIVLETHFDADQSGGAFLTEKTYKCIKYGQPFVIVGAPGSLKALREVGYRTFDSVIDPTYDTITDNNQRWQAVKKVIADISGTHDHGPWLRACQIDCDHNQRLFSQRMAPAVNSLLEKLI